MRRPRDATERGPLGEFLHELGGRLKTERVAVHIDPGDLNLVHIGDGPPLARREPRMTEVHVLCVGVLDRMNHLAQLACVIARLLRLQLATGVRCAKAKHGEKLARCARRTCQIAADARNAQDARGLLATRKQ